jgi:hypothetical protein
MNMHPAPDAARQQLSAPTTAPVQSTPMHKMILEQGDVGHGMEGRGSSPSQGQGAFGAIQEIIRILRAASGTGWSKVDLDVLRQHLIDMDEDTLPAEAEVRRIDGGIQVAVTGRGRTLDAIRQMLSKNAVHLTGNDGWTVRATELPNGVVLIATAADPKQATIIQGLGFAGVMASGTHHQQHHLTIARGEHF